MAEYYKEKAVCRIYGFGTGKYWYTLHLVRKNVVKHTEIGGVYTGPAFEVVARSEAEYDSPEEAFKACERKAKEDYGVKVVRSVAPQLEPKDKIGHVQLMRALPGLADIMIEYGKVFDFKPGVAVRKLILGKRRGRVASPSRVRALRARRGGK